jgi:hypothetical protein
MARKKKPAKIPAMEYPALLLSKIERNPDELNIWEAKNRELISMAIGCAGYTIKPFVDTLKGETIDRCLYFQKNGTVCHLPKDAPKAAQLAEQFLNALSALDSAVEDGDVKFVKECAIQIGAMALKVVAAAQRGKSLGDVLRKHDASVHRSRRGGSREPVWEAAKKDACEHFERFKRGGYVSDAEALRLTRAELIKLQKEGEFEGKVPGLTCLREHLVNKPSSGK